MVFMAAEIVHRSLADVCGPSVFEFGSGTGRNLAALESFGAKECAGCDLSEGMLKVARTRVPQADLLRQDMNDRLHPECEFRSGPFLPDIGARRRHHGALA
jgi:malonyl-CoA O-methyltransferase